MKWKIRFVTVLAAVVVALAMGGAAVFADHAAGKSDTGSAAAETPKNGWDAAHTHYYKDGKMLKGLQTIGGVKYFFDKSSGKMLKGLQTIGGAKYFFNKTNGKGVGKGWFMSKKMYGIGNGKIAVGYKKIGKEHYFFKKSNGKLAGKGMIDKKYYCKGKGKLATGWLAYKKKAYYFNKKNAKMVKGKKVGHLKIPKSGKLGIAYYRGIRILNKKGWKLRAAYTYSYKLKYANRWMRLKNSEAYANYGFKNGKGNCYVMAGTFYVMAKLLGYDVHQVKGKVDLPHSWTEIKQNGKIYVYDPNFRNETGRNGYKIRYGQRGTWRYNHKKRMK